MLNLLKALMLTLRIREIKRPDNFDTDIYLRYIDYDIRDMKLRFFRLHTTKKRDEYLKLIEILTDGQEIVLINRISVDLVVNFELLKFDTKYVLHHKN